MDASLNTFFVQVIVIFLPGIIWERLDARYAAKTKPSYIEIIIRAFLFGLFVYSVEFIILYFLGIKFSYANFAQAEKHNIITNKIFNEILISLPISFILSLVWLYSSRFKWIPKFLQKIGATKKFGDEDVWDYMFNSNIPDVEYVHVRDFENGYVYAGWVNTFSETGKLREIVLLDVIVYDLDGEEKYKIPRMYIARSPENIHIEFPYMKPESGEGSEHG